MLNGHPYVAKIYCNKKAIERFALALIGGLVMLTGSARAGFITAGPYTATGTAGNASASVISTSPSFFITSAAKSFTSVGSLDFEFPVTPSGGTVTYFVTEGITNNTTQTWTDYHELLGAGTGASFVQGSSVQFLLPVDSTYTNPGFPTRAVVASEIDYSGGAIAPGQAFSLTFSITVPDLSASGSVNFTLRQFPTVPEPGTLGVLALGSITLLARRRSSR